MKLSDLLVDAEAHAQRLSSLGDEEAAKTMRVLIKLARSVAEALAD